MDASEVFVQQLLRAQYGITLAKIPETDQRTPDFEFMVNTELKFVAELKTLTYEKPSVERGWEITQLPSGITKATRDDNAPARIGRAIYKAWKQLKEYSVPKIVIRLNEDSFVDILDLHEAYTGKLLYEGEGFSYINTASKRVATGDLCKVHNDLDLFIFIDRRQSDRVFLRFLTKCGYDLACCFFDAPNNPPIPFHRLRQITCNHS